jgi:hypothetical protein
MPHVPSRSFRYICICTYRVHELSYTSSHACISINMCAYLMRISGIANDDHEYSVSTNMVCIFITVKWIQYIYSYSYSIWSMWLGWFINLPSPSASILTWWCTPWWTYRVHYRVARRSFRAHWFIPFISFSGCISLLMYVSFVLFDQLVFDTFSLVSECWLTFVCVRLIMNSLWGYFVTLVVYHSFVFNSRLIHVWIMFNSFSIRFNTSSIRVWVMFDSSSIRFQFVFMHFQSEYSFVVSHVLFVNYYICICLFNQYR